MRKITTICFQTSGGVNRNYGGLDRVTELLANYFESQGFKVYYLSHIKRPNSNLDRQFYLPNEKELFSKENEVFYNSFLREKHIDVLINQEANVNIILPLDKENSSIIYISALHFNPNYITDFHFNHKINKMNIPNFLKSILNWVVGISFVKQKLHGYLHRKLEYNYYLNYSKSDQFVLLSDNFKKDLQSLFVKYDLPKNVTSINNPIERTNKQINISTKKNKLLYVGRLEIGMKQLDKLLNNWNDLAMNFPDWSLHLVGGGPDEVLLKNQVAQKQIPRVFFEGIQNPEKYYEEASIFCFSSSSSEGWGMVLVEAQINGCVPIAFNSYASIKDIIQHDKNGILVPAYDNSIYKKELTKLMSDREIREKMATEAIISSQKFDVEVIGQQWINLIDELNINKNNVL